MYREKFKQVLGIPNGFRGYITLNNLLDLFMWPISWLYSYKKLYQPVRIVMINISNRAKVGVKFEKFSFLYLIPLHRSEVQFTTPQISSTNHFQLLILLVHSFCFHPSIVCFLQKSEYGFALLMATTFWQNCFVRKMNC